VHVDGTADSAMSGGWNLQIAQEGVLQYVMELFGSDLSVTFGNRSAGVSRGVPFNVDYLHSSTNTVHDLYMLMRGTTGTPAAGIGVGMRFDVETSASNYETGAKIEAVTTDVTGGSEDFALDFKTMAAGAAASQIARFTGLNGFPQLIISPVAGTVPNSAGFQMAGTSQLAAGFEQYRYGASSTGTFFAAYKSRHATIGSHTVVNAFDDVFNFQNLASDGTDYEALCSFGSFVDGTPGSNDMPGTWYFMSRPQGATAARIRFRVQADGVTRAEENSALTNTVFRPFQVLHTTSGTPANGIGVGISFNQETSASNNEIIAAIDAVVTDVTATSEDAALVFYTMVAGATATEQMRLSRTAVAGDTAMMLYDVDNNAVERVTVGAADSGGSGFKVLRIPN
jgi:hypothetical protein